MKKTKRITEILSCIQKTKTFADIGCDHGFITYFALSENLVDFAYLSDISSKSLQKSQKLFSDKFSDRVSFNVGDGFENLPDNLEQVAICGMGGMEIVNILKNTTHRPKYLLLSPQKNAELVRRCVLNLGYGIKKDYMILDTGKFYSIISCEYGLETFQYSEKEFEFGRDSLKNVGDFDKYLTKQIKKLESFSNSQEKENRLKYLQELSDELKKFI